MIASRSIALASLAALLGSACGVENIPLDETTHEVESQGSDAGGSVGVMDAESPPDAEADGGDAEQGTMDPAPDAEFADGAVEDASSDAGGGGGDDARFEDVAPDSSVADAEKDVGADARDAAPDARDAAPDLSVPDGVARDAPPDTTTIDAEDDAGQEDD